MLLKRRIKAKVVMCLGLMLLAVANLGSYFLQRGHAFSESVADAGSGFLMGVAIATLLLGIAMTARELKQKRIGRE
jgi:hypothetical protein